MLDGPYPHLRARGTSARLTRPSGPTRLARLPDLPLTGREEGSWYRIRYHDGMEAAVLVRRARGGARLSLRELAERAGTSHATLAAYEAGRVVPGVDTLDRIVRAAGYLLDVELTPIVDASPSARVAKGEELRAALELAAQFPARHARHLTFPPLPRGPGS